MKVLLEVEITGDFEEQLTNDDIVDILNAVIVDGAEGVALTAKYKIIEMINE